MIQSLNDKDKRAFSLIRNQLIHQGKSPTLREINEVTGGKSPRSACIVIERLVKAGVVKKMGKRLKLLVTDLDQKMPAGMTVKIPLVGSVPCGMPVLAQENIETFIPVSTALARKGSVYFLLRATGDSMNKAGIKDGNILLIRQQESADNGDKVVALIDDEATVKIFEKTSQAVILRPKSTNPDHKPIILTNNFKVQGVVKAVLPPDLI